MTHSPIPWTWGCNGDRSIEDEYSTITICRMAGRGKITKLDIANRDFIIKAVNCHYELVESLEEVISMSDRKTKEYDKAKLAIAKAKGTQ